MAQLGYAGREILVPLSEARFDPDQWPKAGAYPLIPFHNRIPDARFIWRDREARLPAHPDAAPHALHGHGSRMAWSLVDQSLGDCAAMQLDSPATMAWPWGFSSRQSFHATANRLDVTLEMTNCDIVPIPAGLGWHPYFPAGTRIVDDAAKGWQVSAEFLPEGPQRLRRKLTGATTYLTDWTEATIALTSGLEITMIREAGLDHLVRFAPEGAAFACLEPVSHAVAAMCDGPSGSMDEIAVGGRMIARFSLSAA